RAPSGLIRVFDTLVSVDRAVRWKIWPFDVLHQVADGRIRVFDQRDAGIDEFGEVMRRDFGRHADGDAFGSVDQQRGDSGGQNKGFVLAAVVVRSEVYGFFFDIGEHAGARTRHTNFGIAHGRGGVAVDRTEVPLAIDQGQTHGEVLRHTHECIVDRLVSVRVVL